MVKRAVAAMLLLTVAACGGADKATGTADKAGGSATSGTDAQIRIVGSATVYPFTTAVAEQFRLRYPQFQAPIVEATGTGGGIKLFCEGKGASAPDMVNASRRMKASEYEVCAANGITDVVEVQIGLDGLVLARSRSGPDFGLTQREIYMALAANPFGKPQTARTWADVNPALPAVKIEVIGPSPTHGTRDSFNEMFMEVGCNTEPAMAELKKSDEAAHKQTCTAIREDGVFIEGNSYNLMVQKLVADPQTVGVFGYGFLEENIDKIKPLAVNGVMPSIEAITNGNYPGARPLFFYVRADRVRTKPGLKELVESYATDATWGAGGLLARQGLTPAPDPVRTAAANAVRNLTPLDASAL